MKPHELLGVSLSASKEEIKSAFRRLALKAHPDKGGSTEQFDQLRRAYKAMMKPRICPECQGKGFISTRKGAFAHTSKCPRCWS